MNQRQLEALDTARHVHCEDTKISLGDGSTRWVSSFDAFEKHAKVPEALALAQLHRAFCSDPCNPEYLEVVASIRAL